MRKSRSSKLRNSLSILFDIAVVVLCSAAAALCIYRFQLDFYQTLSRQNEQPVGYVTYKQKAVQRRFVDRLLWDRLQRESPVYNGDFIRTDDLSEATVFFSSGGIVDLAENSLIQIFDQQLHVSGGGVSVTAQSDFLVSSGGSTIKVDSGGVVSAQTGPGGNLGLWVSEGRATVSTQDGVHEAEAGSAISLSQDGSMEEVPLTAVLSPRPGARIVSPRETGVSVEFAFRPVNYNNGERTRLEISASRDFEEKFVRQDLSDNRLSVNLRPGAWWWRAYPVKTAGEEPPASAAAGKLTIVYSAQPALLTPADGEVFVYKSSNPMVHYRWSQSAEESGIQYYLFEAADNPDMQNPALKAQMRGSSALNNQLGAGRWYWRVSPGFPAEYEGAAAASRVFSFVIEQRDELPAPVLTAPAAESVVSIAHNREDAWFSWKQAAGSPSYTIRISENRDLSRPVITAAVKSNYYIYSAQNTALREGRYYWGVYATSGGTDSQLSPVWSFTASPPLSALSPPDNHTVREEAVAALRFTWKGAVNARRLQISRDADFRSPAVNEAVTGEAHQIRGLEAGNWYWRVVSDTEESAARRLSVAAAVVPLPPPPPPEAAQPATQPAAREEPPPPPPQLPQFDPPDNFVFGAIHLREKSSIDFSWPSAAGSYTFILRKADGTQLLSVPVQGASFRLSDLKILGRARFVWQVRAGDKIIGENRFSLNFPEVRKTHLRDLGTVFSMQRGADSGRVQRITWFRDENASLYELIVERREDGGGHREIYRNTTQNAFAEVPVENGTYRFKVRISNLLGQLEHETNWATFNIFLASSQ
ncbi:MAG: hypothetical protein FWG35_03270 [Spirochaetaceae bacterium]|nr:hypothetical protein [Spirochaetaceae bacterium]